MCIICTVFGQLTRTLFLAYLLGNVSRETLCDFLRKYSCETWPKLTSAQPLVLVIFLNFLDLGQRKTPRLCKDPKRKTWPAGGGSRPAAGGSGALDRAQLAADLGSEPADLGSEPADLGSRI